MDRITSMGVFVKAVDLGSLTAAATALGMSPQMVGKHLGFLEARLGAPLLRRTTRRQSLTDIGRAFYDRSRAILAEVEHAEALVQDMSATPRGRLRVSAPVNFGACRLARVPRLRELVGPPLRGVALRESGAGACRAGPEPLSGQ